MWVSYLHACFFVCFFIYKTFTHTNVHLSHQSSWTITKSDAHPADKETWSLEKFSVHHPACLAFLVLVLCCQCFNAKNCWKVFFCHPGTWVRGSCKNNDLCVCVYGIKLASLKHTRWEKRGGKLLRSYAVAVVRQKRWLMGWQKQKQRKEGWSQCDTDIIERERQTNNGESHAACLHINHLTQSGGEANTQVGQRHCTDLFGHVEKLTVD